MSRFEIWRKSQSKQSQSANRSRPGLELLEQRVTPSTFHVNSLLDTVAVNLKTGKDASGHISLRSAHSRRPMPSRMRTRSCCRRER